MAIKKDPDNPNGFIVTYSKRHPITRQPKNLRRKVEGSMQEAKRVERALVIELEDRLRRIQLPAWPRLIDEFIEDARLRGFRERTIQTYELCLKAHTLEKWTSKLVDEITPHEIRQLVEERVGKKSVAHQQNLVKFIKGVFQCAVERGYLKANPTPTFRLRIPDRVKSVLTEEQASLLLRKAYEWQSEWFPHWALALYTGLRSGELYALTWEKVNFDSRQITVDSAWNSMDGFKSTKSGHERVVPINESLMVVMKELKLAGEGGPFVLPRQTKWNKGEQARELRKFLALIGLPSIRFHDLRATWATMLLSKGTPPAQVMKMGGWRDMKTMMIYTRMAGIDVRGATDCLKFHDGERKESVVLKFST